MTESGAYLPMTSGGWILRTFTWQLHAQCYENVNASDDFAYAFQSLEGHNPSLSPGHVELLGGILSSNAGRSPQNTILEGYPVSVSPAFKPSARLR